MYVKCLVVLVIVCKFIFIYKWMFYIYLVNRFIGSCVFGILKYLNEWMLVLGVRKEIFIFGKRFVIYKVIYMKV